MFPFFSFFKSCSFAIQFILYALFIMRDTNQGKCHKNDTRWDIESQNMFLRFLFILFIENFKMIIKKWYNNKSKIIYAPPERRCVQQAATT